MRRGECHPHLILSSSVRSRFSTSPTGTQRLVIALTNLDVKDHRSRVGDVRPDALGPRHLPLGFRQGTGQLRLLRLPVVAGELRRRPTRLPCAWRLVDIRFVRLRVLVRELRDGAEAGSVLDWADVFYNVGGWSWVDNAPLSYKNWDKGMQ